MRVGILCRSPPPRLREIEISVSLLPASSCNWSGDKGSEVNTKVPESQSTISRSGAPQSQQVLDEKARCSITSDRADCTITTRYRASLGTVPRSSKDTKSKLSAPEAQFVKCEASL